LGTRVTYMFTLWHTKSLNSAMLVKDTPEVTGQYMSTHYNSTRTKHQLKKAIPG